MKPRLHWIVFVIILCCATVGGGIFLLDRFNLIAILINGRPFEVSPNVAIIESGEPGAEEIVTFVIKNLAQKEISIVGAKTGCSCTVAENLPVTILPNEVGSVNFRVTLPMHQSSWKQSIAFMISSSNKLKIAHARIVASIPNPLPFQSEEDEDDIVSAETNDALQEVQQ